MAEGLLKRKELLEKKLEGLREMRALGDITREEFLEDKRKIEAEQEKLELQIRDLRQTEHDRKSGELDIKEMQKTLNCWIDTAAPTISEELIDEFVLQISIWAKTSPASFAGWGYLHNLIAAVKAYFFLALMAACAAVDIARK